MFFSAMATIGTIAEQFFLFLILLSVQTIDAQTTSRTVVPVSNEFEEFNQMPDRLVLANNTLENFNHALNFVTNNSELQPLFLSIGSFGFRNDILDRVTEYLTKRTTDYYRCNLEDFDERKIDLRPGLTWIIVVDEYNALVSHVREHANFWRAAKQFFILFVSKKTNENPNHWLKILNILWRQHRVCKVLIASIHENFRYLYRYMPFVKVGKKFGSVQRLDINDTSCHSVIIQNKGLNLTIRGGKSRCQIKSTKGSSKIFEDFQDFNGYPVHVTIFASTMMNVTTNKDNTTSYTMLDAKLMNLVEERLRSKFRLNVIDAEEVGDPFIKALDSLIYGGSDVVFTAYLTKLYLKQFVFTTSIFEDKVCLIAPASEPIPKFFMPLLPFTNELWLLVIVYNLVIAILWILIRRIQSAIRCESKVTTTVPVDITIKVLTYRISKRSAIDHCFKRARPLDVDFRYSRPHREPRRIHPCIVGSFDLLTLACYPLSGGKTCMERAFLFGTLFFGLIVIGLYQSYLVSSLSKPIFYPELSTLEDVVQSNRTIITKYRNLQENTFIDGTTASEILQKKLQITTSLEKTFDMVAYRGFVSIGRKSAFQLKNLAHYYNKETNKLLLHVVEECPRKYALSYPVRLYCPYLQRINGLLLRMRQSGIIYKWFGDMVLQVKLQTAKSIPKRSDERVKLSLEHLSLTFFVLGIGLFFSTLVFLGELHYARRLHCSTLLKRPSTLSNKQNKLHRNLQITTGDSSDVGGK